MPEITAKYVPSTISASAAWAACLAAAIADCPMEPEVSMMMISPAAPVPVWPAVPAPLQSTVTIAWTSVPPSGRNSFW